MSSNETEGIDAEQVTVWLQERADIAPPLSFDLIAGGHSNLTFQVTDTTGRKWVLRRPPLKQVLATAHDMGREHKIISSLAGTDVPVAPAVGLCTDESVNGAPFYVMDFVEGTVVRDLDTAKRLTEAQRRTAGNSTIDVLARIHAVDVDAVGLGDLGKREDYIARQLKRWYGQFEKSKTRELPIVDEVHDLLRAAIPDQGPATIVHGDYRLDNCMVGADGEVVAVLDWEICTLGDPLADVGLLLVYSPDEEGTSATGVPAVTALPGFPTQQEMLDRYQDISGRDLTHIDYYVAFGYWKLACILEGVYARYAGGAMGGGGEAGSFDFFGQQVITIFERAREAARRVG